MSKNDAVTFVQRVNEDTALQKKLEKTGKSGVEEMVKFAAGEGYRFSAEELVQAITPTATEGELDESALEQVAGGFNPQPDPPGFAARFIKWENTAAIKWMPSKNFG